MGRGLFAAAVVLAVLAISPARVRANGTDELDRVISNIQAKYVSVKEFHASFNQASTVKVLNKVQRAQGEVWFKKPGKMRWNFYTPYRDEIVSNGKRFWYYNKEDKQVVESSLEQVVENPTTTTFLQGLGAIKDAFLAKFPKTGKKDPKGNYLVELEPKGRGGDEVNRFTVVVDPKTWIVKTIYLYDPFGNVTTVTFKDIEINRGISNSLFTFKVPKGVEVIRAPTSSRK